MNQLYEQDRREQEEQKKYEDAKKDALKAINSIEKLSPPQQEQLLREVLAITGYINLLNEIQKYRR